MLGRYLSQYALLLARWAAWSVRPLENAALISLRWFMTPRGPMLFAAALVILIAALASMIALAPGPGSAAWTKLALGVPAFLLFCGYLRAYFASHSENDAILAGLRDAAAASSDRPAARAPGALSAGDLAWFLIGLCAAHTAVAAGLLEGGFGPKAYGASGAPTLPSSLDWLGYALWASLGAVDLFGVLPRSDEVLWRARFDWGWAAPWLILYRLILLGVLFSLASRAFNARRQSAIALQTHGLWPAKQAHLQRLGRGGFTALAASLSDPDPARRQDAALMLGVAQDFQAEAAEALIPALADQQDEVRMQAAASLGALGPAAALSSPALTGKLFDASPDVQREAAAALGAVATDDRRLATPAMAALASAIPQEPHLLEKAEPRTLAAMAASLAKIASAAGEASDQAIAAADRLRGHRDAHVRQVASEGFGQLIGAVQAKTQMEARRRTEAEAAEREAAWTQSSWPPDWAR